MSTAAASGATSCSSAMARAAWPLFSAAVIPCSTATWPSRSCATRKRARAFGSGSPTIALIAEMDGLPGLGHACGHNIIATAGAGAGAALAQVVEHAGGSVVVMGTPAEEGGGGKIIMARRGAFADIDAAMMVHPAGIDLPAMNVLAIATIAVEYHGKAAHASAFPHRGINALDALASVCADESDCSNK